MSAITANQQAWFQTVKIGELDPPIFYLALSVDEYNRLGGWTDRQYPTLRSLRCVADRIDHETGVADLTILLDLTGRRGQAVRDVPFEDPVGGWPSFAGSAGRSWHFLTSCQGEPS